MEINTEVLDLKINGVDYKLTYMDYDSVEEMLEKLDEEGLKDPKVMLGVKKSTLLSSGLPEEILRKLQMKHINDLFEELTGVKKN